MDIEYHEWRGEPGFRHGESSGTEVTGDGLRIGSAAGVQDSGEYAWWTSPEHGLPFGATELVVSWNATTPPGTWLTVELEARTDSGRHTPWYSMARWAHGETDIHRTSVEGQRDEFARVDVDRVVAVGDTRLRGYRLRVTLFRAEGTGATPTLAAVGAVASTVEERLAGPGSAPGPARGIELPVPRYPQRIHRGRFVEYGGGGDGWCSPASTEMVLEYWGVGPSEQELSWVPRDYPDRTVVHAARHTFDQAYGGTGNWAFNVAYAAHYGMRARVTRLRSLVDVEEHIVRGVPVITSQAFTKDELDGADYDTAGHLLVVIGFTEDGDVIVNDPAADDTAGVRRVYPRDQFETVWQRSKRRGPDGDLVDTSAGVVYLIEP